MDHNLLAQNPHDIGIFQGLGVLADFSGESPLVIFTKVISLIIGVMTVIAFLWFIFVLFIGAIAWLSSGGDKTKLQEAQKQITTGLTGLLIVIVALFIVRILETVLGINILDLFNILSSLHV